MSTGSKKELLVGLLSNLVTGKDIQKSEARLKSLFGAGFCAALLDVLCDESQSSFVRQQSGMVLRQLVCKHWDKTDSRFEAPQIGDSEKAVIRERLLADGRVVGSEVSGIRRATALVVAAVADYDFPDEWPALIHTLAALMKRALAARSAPLLIGTVLCLELFAEHCNASDCVAHGQKLLTLLSRVACIGQRETAAIPKPVLCSVLNTFMALLDTLATVKPSDVARVLSPTLQQFLETTMHFMDELSEMRALATRPSANDLDLVVLCVACVSRVLKQQYTCVRSLPLMASGIAPLITCVWKCLQSALVFWRSLCIDASESGCEEVLKSVVRLADSCLLLFVETVMCHRKSAVRALVDDKLSAICYTALQLAALSDEHLILFKEDSCEYFSCELDVFRGSDLRASVRNALLRIVELRKKHSRGYEALCHASQRLLKESLAVDTTAIDSAAHRQLEAALIGFRYLIASVKDVSQFAPSVIKFDIDALLDKVLMPLLTAESSELWLKTGCVLLVSEMVAVLSVPRKLKLLQCGAIIPRCLLATAGPTPAEGSFALAASSVSFLSALLCDGGFSANEEANGELKGILPKVVPQLCALLSAAESNEHVLKHLLKVIAKLVDFAPQTMAAMCTPVLKKLIALWNANKEDEGIASSVRRVVCAFAQWPVSAPTTRRVVVPVIMSIVKAQHRTDNGVVADALLLLAQICDCRTTAPSSKKSATDLEDIFYESVLGAVVELCIETGDNKTMAATCEVVCSLLRLSPERVVRYGHLEAVLRMVDKLLFYRICDSAAMAVCSVLSTLLLTLAARIGADTLTRLLLAVVCRVHVCVTSELRQKLLVVFARIATQSPATVLSVLREKGVGIRVYKRKMAPRGSGEKDRFEEHSVDALPFVLDAWCDAHSDFMYAYFRKVSLKAMVACLQSKSRLLAETMVLGDTVVDTSAPRRTRSAGPLKRRKVSAAFRLFECVVRSFSVDDTESATDIDSDDFGSDEENYSPSRSRKAAEDSDEADWVPSKRELDDYNLDIVDEKLFWADDASIGSAEIDEYPEALCDSETLQMDEKATVVECLQSLHRSDEATFDSLAKLLNPSDLYLLKRIKDSVST